MNNIREKFRKRRADLWCITVDELDTPLTIIETLEYNWSNKIDLFVYDEKWSYCMHVWPPRGDVTGHFYGPRFSFCDPYPDRLTALESAVNKMLTIYAKSNHRETKYLVEWAKSLILPTQLRLI